MDENHTTPTPEELQSEQEALAEVQDDKLRSNVVASLGLEDNEENKAVIDKVVALQKDSRTKLSKAISQKIDWRAKATNGTKSQPAPQAQPQQFDTEAVRKQTADAVTAQLEQRDIDEMEYPDDIKAEIKNVARVQGISVRKAEKTGYIQHLIGEAVKAGKIDEAAVSRTPRATPAEKGGSKMPTFDMSTEEGRKAFDQWKKDNGKA